MLACNMQYIMLPLLQQLLPTVNRFTQYNNVQ